jgi:hypothetical protein
VAQDQRVEFLFAAQVSGQEQLQKLISSVDSLRKETEQLKSANAGLASSTDAVIRNGTRYNNALDAQSKALRQNRQGTQQLGMQINDFATSVSTGASPVQAFNQQIGQVGIAMSMMGGKLGTVGAFLAGPWGAAVVIATMALGPLIEAFFNTSKAAQELQEAEKAGRQSSINLLEAKAELDKALGKNTNNYKLAKQAAFDSALADLAAANAAVTASQIRIGLAQKEKKIVRSIQESEGGAIGGFLLESFGFGNVDAAVKESNQKINAYKDAQAALLKARTQLIEANKTSQVGSAGRAAASIPAPKMEKQKEDPLAAMANDYSEFEKMVRDLDMESLKEAERMLKELPDFIPPVTEEMQKIIDSTNELNDSFDNIGNAVANSFKGMLTGAMSFRTAMKGIIGAVIDELFRLYVVQQVVGVVKGALGGLFGVPVPPGKAIGGSVGKNRPYMVGEQGPELFIPGGSGTIIPNRNLPSNGGGSSFNISVDARGSNDPAAVRAQVQQGILEAAPAIIAAAESRTISNLRRPRLGGAMQ